ncbi:MULTISPECIES: dihydroxyacetone kinase subunit DhaK [Clostridium]|uniref:PTS-dependent dihydroxyacetone kinase 1, dihydroxyacetone-binding subunit DhaK n=2 Tax=Clostridium TaxID=1485 RepID=A0AAD1YIY9_9CLOT|nr:MULTISPECIES: dihydroxyacetone kinase subunit DhaK [Clostridium]CAI3211854.1 PTS-dependent dihydroxyacetone kinase 1, dihydroxyacetone-binding subunit DhaK [Clostridium neonatale]CAI3214336.1 PTS-dependent dihydroxyacetone kinase 1, dihydroxyacetone-binding subunit DhaK [Clostridium neonatale]CAI3215718.1 PTS-dependent dihydroxyacetone kinase 1, dihydroxyacetone-binding subunit DhaK [Clostridium neonatale]CAI3246440.1 PTS-dependent dihydroxyacetone kinase 1, dihydroxyacetone-binding subunit 
MKKLINDPNNVLNDMIDGIVAAYPEYVKKLEGFNVIVRNEKKKNKVALVSGGGSGHEPAHAGYVGYGMLDGAVCGEVFTSPTPDQVYEAIKATNDGQGVLLVIKNYTGDVMNFEMAKEMAEMDGIKVEEVIVNDDVAVENSIYTAGRRGIAGTVFVHKIAGAKAEMSGSLEEVKAVAEKVISNVRTMGMSLSSCIIPAMGKANFEIGHDEVEIGMGIHGEPGTHREKISSADSVAEQLMSKIFSDIELKGGDEVSVMINGLGSTTNMELFIVNKKVNEILKDKGIEVYKTFVGEFMTSLEMAGCSISILKLDDELKELLEDSADTPAFKSL